MPTMISMRQEYRLGNEVEGWRIFPCYWWRNLQIPSHTRLCSMTLECLILLLQKSGFGASMNLPQGVWGLVIESLQLPTQYSQWWKRCQVPDEIWDGACEFVGIKISASRNTYTDYQRQIQRSPHQVCFAFYSSLLIEPPFLLSGSNG